MNDDNNDNKNNKNNNMLVFFLDNRHLLYARLNRMLALKTRIPG